MVQFLAGVIAIACPVDSLADFSFEKAREVVRILLCRSSARLPRNSAPFCRFDRR
jgi:hypothetical protein